MVGTFPHKSRTGSEHRSLLRALLRVGAFLFAMVWSGCQCGPPKGAPDEVYISGGTFTMGHDPLVPDSTCDPAADCNDFAPKHTVTLTPYFIDKLPVTIGQYRACIDEAFCEEPLDLVGTQYRPWTTDGAHDDLPVFGIQHQQAERYCQWKGRRLPTEAEWERAARGSDSTDYPWGNSLPTCDRIPDACAGNGFTVEALRAAGSTPADMTKEGVLDLYGNGSEHVADFYDRKYYAHSPQQDPKGPATNVAGGWVVRGEGFAAGYPKTVWDDTVRGFPAWARNSDFGYDGVRCARDVRYSSQLPVYRGLAWREIR